MNLFLILFLIGILGFVLNRKNIILMLISIEIMLLAITLLISANLFTFDGILSQGFATIFDSNLFLLVFYYMWLFHFFYRSVWLYFIYLNLSLI